MSENQHEHASSESGHRELFTDADAREWLVVPQHGDDKYSRGVLGMITGSEPYPGAAVLGAEAACRTGVGMVRYLGPRRAADLVLARRPEVVTLDGRVQAWLLGSGIDAEHRDDSVTERMTEALSENVPVILDAGALDLAVDAPSRVIVTPHARELVRLLAAAGIHSSVDEVTAQPAEWARRTARQLGIVVLLKGNLTHIASPDGAEFAVREGPAWLATAGTGDVLGGVLGAIVATSHRNESPDDLAALAATAAFVHARAGLVASSGGPIAALDVAEAVPAVVASLLEA